MLTNLKVSSFACKYVFYRQEHNANENPMELNFEVLEMQKWNIPTDRTQRVDEKNGVVCLIIMFTHRVMVIKMSKNGSLFVFSADDSKKLVSVWAKYLNIFFQKMVWLIGFAFTVREILRVVNIKKVVVKTVVNIKKKILYFQWLTSC